MNLLKGAIQTQTGRRRDVQASWPDNRKPTEAERLEFERQVRESSPHLANAKAHISSFNPHGYGVPRWSLYAVAIDETQKPETTFSDWP